MLFLPDATFETKVQLTEDLETGKIDPEQAYTRILDLDPHDHIALVLLAKLRSDAGDRDRAEQLLLRAIQAQPCAWQPYHQLSLLLTEQDPLSHGLLELASRKLLWDETAIEELEDLTSSEWRGISEEQDLDAAERIEDLADRMLEQSKLEPATVTERLRPYRLVHQLQTRGSLDPEVVDALIQEGSSMVPLLIGTVRGWVQDVILDGGVASHALALLGQLGDTGVIPDVLEMAPLDDPELSLTAGWTLDQIVARHQADAARVLLEIAPELDGGERIAVAERLAHNPQMDPDGVLYERLFENFDRVEKEDRDFCFQVLLSTEFALRGGAGMQTARNILRRHGGILSRKMRRDCENMLEEFRVLQPDPPPPPNPASWTVYQICSGEIDWEEERKAAAGEEDEDDFIPEPARRKSTPARNDPCWCGSGKKYKKCHLDIDAQQEKEGQPLSEFDPLRRKVGKLLETIPERENRAAVKEFFASEIDHSEAVGFWIDWMVHDRISPTFGRTLLQEYLHRHGSQLTGRERQFMESSISSYVDLYEIQQVHEGDGVDVTSLTSSEAFFAHDVSLSKVLDPGDGLLVRAIEGDRGREFTGAGFKVPRPQLEALRQWMDEDRRRTGLSWPDYLKRNWPGVRARNQQLAQESMPPPPLQNRDRENLVASEAHYRVINRAELIAALRSSPEIDENEDGTYFTWLSALAGTEGATVLGAIRIVGDQLILACNSKPRLERAREFLAQLAGSSVSFENEKFTEPEELSRRTRENPQPAEATSRIPPDVERKVVGEYLEQHYARWLDMKLPALDGKTPRQAVKNAAGKRKVADLLKQFENEEARKRKTGEPYYDVSRLRAELGIKK